MRLHSDDGEEESETRRSRRQAQRGPKAISIGIKGMAKPQTCQSARALVDATKGPLSAEELLDQNPSLAPDRDQFIKGVTELRVRYGEHSDEIATIEALNDFCRTKDEEGFLNVIRREHERDVRSCRVSSHGFKQTFSWVESFGSGKGAWVVVSQPQGPCGTVELSRFESDEGSTFKFWRYVARKAVTNPEGMILDQKCASALDQNEYVYDWKTSRNSRLGCEFVEFSPL